MEHARYGAEGRLAVLLEVAAPVELAEELVGPVDQVDDHRLIMVNLGADRADLSLRTRL